MTDSDEPRLSTFWKTAPWVCIHYAHSDKWVDEHCGQAEVVFECAICGSRHTVSFKIMSQHDPLWKDELIGMYGLPQCREQLEKFLRTHEHSEDRDRAPDERMALWAKPMLNVDALGGPISMEAMKSRLTRDIVDM